MRVEALLTHSNNMPLAAWCAARRLVQTQNRSRLCNQFSSVFSRNFGVRHKVVDLHDAVAVVKSNDTVCVAGFVAQSCPEALCRALGERYDKTQEPKNLRLLYGGGPGDWDKRGINHLGKPGMLRTVIAGHFGQTPQVAKQVLANQIPGYAIPLGAVTRMIRAQASNSPGFITRVGLGTMVDPRQTGGALNQKARDNPLIKLMELDGHEYLRFPALPINVALIRGTTADPEGNITFEHESILGDAKNVAMATRSSGGIVICQVERVAMHGSLPSRSVHIPGPFVDMVVVADKTEHGVSYFTDRNPVWTGEIRKPLEDIPVLPFTQRKFVARRGAMELRPDDIVNLGIGMPDGVASVASEEGIFPYVTLTTEAGVFGGVGATGLEFGPANNPESFNEMSQQFDFYSGGGLNVCFLGMAQCNQVGDVNVSRLTMDSLTGPGGFIDITQSTGRVVFMGTFSKKGLKVKVHKEADGSPRVEIAQEGKFFTFQQNLNETTFAAKQALLNGQRVLYVTERCVFELSHRGLELVEIAPGIDLERDILVHMQQKPYFKSREAIRVMDSRIFLDQQMNLYDDMFSMERQFSNRLEYNKENHTMFVDLRNLIIVNREDVDNIEKLLTQQMQHVVSQHPDKAKVRVVVNYEGFDCKAALTQQWEQMAKHLEETFYDDVRRYSGRVFLRKKLSDALHLEGDEDYWHKFTGDVDDDGKSIKVLTRQKLVQALSDHLHVKSSRELIAFLMNHRQVVHQEDFHDLIHRLNFYRQSGRLPVSKDELEGFHSLQPK